MQDYNISIYSLFGWSKDSCSLFDNSISLSSINIVSCFSDFFVESKTFGSYISSSIISYNIGNNTTLLGSNGSI